MVLGFIQVFLCKKLKIRYVGPTATLGVKRVTVLLGHCHSCYFPFSVIVQGYYR